MKALWRFYKESYSKRYVLFAILAILFMIVDTMVSLLIPFFSKRIIDDAIPNGNLTLVYQMGAIVIGIALGAVIATILNNVFAQYLSTAITKDIRNTLFKKIQALSLSNVDSITTGKLLTVVTNDTTQIQMILMMSFRIIIRAPITLIGAMIMAYITNANLFIVIVIFVPLLVFGFVMLFKKAAPLFKQMQQKIDQLNTKLSESIGGAREIKAFVTESVEQQKFDVVNEDYNQAIIKANRVIAFLNPLVTVISTVAIGGVVYVAASIISRQGDTQMAGSVVTYIAYVQQIIMSLMMISAVAIMLSRAMVSAERAAMVLDVEIDIENTDEAIEKTINGNITFDNVCFSYLDGNNEDVGMTLSQINVTIPQGKMIGITGSTGCGKTTFVQLIPRMYDVTKGRILIDGIDVKDFDLKTLRKQISYVTQEAIIFQGTFASNIRQGKDDATIEEIQQAAQFAIASEFIESSSDGYDSTVSQGGANLSGGQKQRLSLARAIVRKPKILILDDSTSAVDATTEVKIKENIRRIQGITTIIVAQKISSIMDCDQIIVLNNKGHIDGYGTHQELLESSKVYQEIYQSQFGGVEDAR